MAIRTSSTTPGADTGPNGSSNVTLGTGTLAFQGVTSTALSCKRMATITATTRVDQRRYAGPGHARRRWRGDHERAPLPSPQFPHQRRWPQHKQLRDWCGSDHFFQRHRRPRDPVDFLDQGRAGTLEFAGTVGNTYSGTTTVNEGDLLLAKSAAGGTITASGTAGSFKLSFAGQTTSALTANSTPSQVATALQALSSIGSNVSVSGSAGNYIIFFTGPLSSTPFASLTSVGTGGTTTLNTAGGTVLVSGGIDRNLQSQFRRPDDLEFGLQCHPGASADGVASPAHDRRRHGRGQRYHGVVRSHLASAARRLRPWLSIPRRPKYRPRYKRSRPSGPTWSWAEPWTITSSASPEALAGTSITALTAAGSSGVTVTPSADIVVGGSADNYIVLFSGGLTGTALYNLTGTGAGGTTVSSIGNSSMDGPLVIGNNQIVQGTAAEINGGANSQTVGCCPASSFRTPASVSRSTPPACSISTATTKRWGARPARRL